MHELNLLSPLQKTELKSIKLQFLIKNLWFQVVSVLVIISTVLLFNFLLLKNNLNYLESEVNDEKLFFESKNISSLEELIKQLNSQLNTAAKVQEDYIKWSDKIVAITGLVPDGVSLSDLQLVTSDKEINITGVAKTRDNLLQLQSNLNNHEFFTNVTTPISSLIQKENITFKITATLSDSFYD